MNTTALKFHLPTPNPKLTTRTPYHISKVRYMTSIYFRMALFPSMPPHVLLKFPWQQISLQSSPPLQNTFTFLEPPPAIYLLSKPNPEIPKKKTSLTPASTFQSYHPRALPNAPHTTLSQLTHPQYRMAACNEQAA